MTIQEASEKIIEFVVNTGGVSWVNLESEVRALGFEPRGDLEYGNLDMNVIFWAGMSQDFCDIMFLVRQSERLHAMPCSTWVYMVDGKMLSLPIVKRAKKTPYKETHWLPMVFNKKEATKLGFKS